MFLPDIPKALAEAARVLKPGGLYLASVWGAMPQVAVFDLDHAVYKGVRSCGCGGLKAHRSCACIFCLPACLHTRSCTRAHTHTYTHTRAHAPHAPSALNNSMPCNATPYNPWAQTCTQRRRTGRT